jgi:hypothetical protein
MGYAEATFMTFAALALLAMRSRRWCLAAVAGFLAGLTRPVGVLLAIPAAVEGWQHRASLRTGVSSGHGVPPSHAGSRWGRVSADAKAALPVITPIAGLFAYLIWAARRTHDFWYPLRAQQDSVRRGHWVDPVRAVAHNVHELFAGDHLSAGVHAASAIVVALGSRNLDSLERYGLATLPFVLAGADVTADPARERAVLVLASAGLVAASVLAFTGVLVP